MFRKNVGVEMETDKVCLKKVTEMGMWKRNWKGTEKGCGYFACQ